MTDFSHAPQFDTGPLGWVMGEIREALGKSGAALNDATSLNDDAQADSLKHAKAYLHQAHGALQMVDVDGVGVMTQVAEEALDRFRDGLLPCTRENTQVVTAVYQAVIEYLEELLSGAAQQPARLFPYYRDVQEKLGAARIHPADLFFPDLSLAAVLPQHSAPATQPDYAACRARFEKALLPFIKSNDAASQQANAAAMQDAIALIAAAQKESAGRTFWVAMQSFAELVAKGQLGSTLYTKQLFGMINLQIRRLTQGEGSLPEAMMRDALFFIAAAATPSPTAQALRTAYRLEGVIPGNYEAKRYGRIDPEALKNAKEALARATVIWDKLSSELDEALEAEFEELLATVAAAGEKLGAPALARLQQELVRANADVKHTGRNPQFNIEMATAMLFVENGLDQIRQLPDDFDAHAEVVGARLLALAAGETPPEAPQWQGDLSRQIQQHHTVAVLAAEMKNGLRQVEKVLDDYYADNSKRPTLSQIDPVLHQLQGAVAILDQDDAMRAALHVKEAVRALAASEGNPEMEAASLQNIAQNIGALGFFVDMLAKNFEAAKDRFAFDREEGMLREVPFEKPSGETAFEPEPIVVPEPAPVSAAAEDAVAVSEPAAPAVAAAPTAPVMTAPPVQVEGEVEAELLEIFIMEAQEVLELVTATLPKLKAQPSNQETITVVRRAFHTLKGSGRMVGLNNFGEGAALVEKVMNLWLSEGREATPDLLALLGWASTDMTAWVDELAANGTSPRSSDALVASATRMLEGGDFTMEAAAPAVVDVAPEAPSAVNEMPAAPEIEILAEAIDLPELLDPFAEPVMADQGLADTVAESSADLPQDEEIVAQLPFESDADAEEPFMVDAEEMSFAAEPGTVEAVHDTEETIDVVDVVDAGEPESDLQAEAEAISFAIPGTGNVIEFPGMVRSTPPIDDNTKRIGTLEIPLPLYNIYLAETDEIIRLLTQDFSEWRHEPHRLVTPQALKAAHTLGGTSATVGFAALRDIAHALEMALDTPAPVLDPSERDLLDETVACAREMLQGFALGEIADPNPDLVARLNKLRGRLVEQESAVYVGAESSEVGVQDEPESLDKLFADTHDSVVAEPVAEEVSFAEEVAVSEEIVVAEDVPAFDDIEEEEEEEEAAPSLAQDTDPPIDAAELLLDEPFEDEMLDFAHPASETVVPAPVIEYTEWP